MGSLEWLSTGRLQVLTASPVPQRGSRRIFQTRCGRYQIIREVDIEPGSGRSFWSTPYYLGNEDEGKAIPFDGQSLMDAKVACERHAKEHPQ